MLAIDLLLTAYKKVSLLFVCCRQSAPLPASAAFKIMTDQQVAIQNQLPSWLAQIHDCHQAAQQLRAAQHSNDSHTGNPFTVIGAQLAIVQADIDDVKNHKIVALTSNITTFNTLWTQKGSTALQDLLNKTSYINDSVIALPNSVAGDIGTLQSGLDRINDLYAAPTNLGQLPASIDSSANALTFPATGGLAAMLTNNEASLDGAADLTAFVNAFAQLDLDMRALNATNTDLGTYMDGYAVTSQLPPDWNTLQAKTIEASNKSFTTIVELDAYDGIVSSSGSFLHPGGPAAAVTDINTQTQLTTQRTTIQNAQTEVSSIVLPSTGVLASASNGFPSSGSITTVRELSTCSLCDWFVVECHEASIGKGDSCWTTKQCYAYQSCLLMPLLCRSTVLWLDPIWFLVLCPCR